MSSSSESSLVARFPALRKLRPRSRRRRIPVIRQMTATDCGAACLAMVLGLHLRGMNLEDVRDILGSSRDGVTAKALISAARRLGLRGRGIALDVDRLEFLSPGSILHWRFSHYVVFERIRKDQVWIVDPASGRRRVSLEEFRKNFTGVALLFEPAEPAQQDSSRRSVFRHIVPLLRHTRSFSRIAVLSAALQVCGLAAPALVGVLVDRVLPRQDYRLLWVLGAGIATLLTFNVFASLVRGHLLAELRTRLDAAMTFGFLEHLVSLSYSFFQIRPAGDLLARMNVQASIREALSTTALSSILDGSLVILYLGLLFLADPPLATLVLMLWGTQVALFVVQRRHQRALLLQSLDLQGRNQTYRVSLLNNMQTLKAFGVEEQMVQSYANLYVDVLNVELDRARLANWVDSLIGTVRLAAPLVVLGAGAYRVLSGDLTLGEMLAVNAIAGALLVPLMNLLGLGGQLLHLDAFLERVNDILDLPPERGMANRGSDATLGGEVALDAVSFRYGPDAPFAVRDVSLRVRRGEFVAVVGRSGAGKSTLANLLLGLYLPSGGKILFDGVDLSQLDLRAVRSQLGVVLQDPTFFDATIRDNISLNDAAMSMEQVIEAARLACIHDDIMAMPLQYSTPLADRGMSLSGGQRQRLALARALARRPAILLLDEATSALDTLSERQIQKALDQLKCTRVVIAHRLSTIRDADRILVMEGGRIVETGRHDDLLERGGAYARLVTGQLEGPAHVREAS